MPRYIDADALKAEMSEECPDDKMVQLIVMIFNACVDDAPTADVRENRKGKWIRSERDENFYVCSVCKNDGYKDRMAWRKDFIKAYLNFCPNCGSDNRGDSDA